MNLKEMKEKLNPRVAFVGGAIVLTTTIGTCQYVYDQEAAPAAVEPAPQEGLAEPEPQPEEAVEAQQEPSEEPAAE